MSLTDDQVKEAIKQMESFTKDQVDQYKAGISEYKYLSAREVLYALGFEADADQVLQAIADKGFDYCLDPHVGHRERDTERITYPSADACRWGVDQLHSRIRFIS